MSPQNLIRLVAIVGLALAIWLIYSTGKHHGQAAERQAWQARELEQQQAYAAELAKLRAEKDAELGRLQGDLAKAEENYEIQKRRAANEKARNDRIAADVRAGRLVLRDPGAPAGEACSGPGPAGPATASPGDGPPPQPGQLSSELAGFLWSEAARADEVIEDLEQRLTFAQDVIGAYYRMARDCSVVGN